MTSRTLIERLTLALSSSDLKHHRYSCDLDKVIASGWASARNGVLGSLTVRAKDDRTNQSRRKLIQQVKKIAVSRARGRKRGGTIEDIHKVALASVSYWLEPRCQTCQGMGLIVLENKQHLSNIVCQSCHGSGLRDMPTIEDVSIDWDEYRLQKTIVELLVILDEAYSNHTGTVKAVLRNDEPIDQPRKIFKSDAK